MSTGLAAGLVYAFMLFLPSGAGAWGGLTSTF